LRHGQLGCFHEEAPFLGLVSWGGRTIVAAKSNELVKFSRRESKQAAVSESRIREQANRKHCDSARINLKYLGFDSESQKTSGQEQSLRILPPSQRRVVIAGALCVLAGGCVGPNDTNAAKDIGWFGGRRDTSPVSDATYGTLMRVGDATRDGGDLANAVNIYRRAADKAPADDSTSFVRLGFTLIDLRSYNEAVSAFRAGLQRTPKNADARRGLGNALVSLDQPQLAAAEFEAALALTPDDPRIYNSLGVVLDMGGDHRQAQELYRDGLSHGPDSLALQNNLGLSLAMTKDYPEAIAILRSVASHPSATARNRQNLALVYGLAGQNEAAEQVARMDLDESSVKNNVAYYGVLRALSDEERIAAIRVGGGAPAKNPASAN
jgi:Flp pilus assembly protein TadD